MSPRVALFPMVAFFALGVAAAILFGSTEHALVQTFWPNAYLDSDFFYYPGLAASAGLGLVLAAICGLLGAALRLIRPGVQPREAAVALLGAAVAYVLMAQVGVPMTAGLSAAYSQPAVGAALSFGILLPGFYVLAFLMLRALAPSRTNGSTGDRRPPHRRRLQTVAVSTAIVLALVVWRPLYGLYLPLYAVLTLCLLLPAIAACLFYLLLCRAEDRALEKMVRMIVAAAVVVAAGLHVAHLSRLQNGSGALAAVFLFALVMAAAIVLVRSVMVSLFCLPLSLILLLFAAPWIDSAYAPRVSDAVDPGDHLMLISVDTLRRDVISAYNPDARPTPRIDALIADGAQFTRAWVPSSWTLPSVVSMMTGVSPAVHQANDFGARIPGNLDTVAEEFRHRGYAAEAFVENLLLGPERGLSRGFDRYVHLPTLEPHPTLGQRLLTRVWPDRFIAEGGARGIVEMAWRRIRRHRTEKLFLWLHLLEPHAPYLPPPAFWPEGVPLDANHPDVSNGPIGGRVSREVLLNEMYPLYLAEVQYIDHCIGLLLDRMRRIGAYDRTAIVFTGDHGEEFGEQGRWGHGNTPVETLIHMPLSLKAPAVEPGSVDDRMVDTSGFPATMLHLADPSFRPAPHLVSAWSTDPPPRRDDESTTPTFVYSTSIPREGRHEDALVFGERPWKYVYDREGDSDRLYDLKFDPDETAPATEAHPDLLARGRELYHAHLREGARIREILDLAGRQDLEYSDDVVEELRKLGYVN